MAAHEIYARELGQLQHGKAPRVPGPEPNGYDETRVGDVGYIAAADDPINSGFDVQADFEPLVLRPNTLYKNFFRPGAHHGYSISRFDLGITGFVIITVSSTFLICFCPRSVPVGTGIQFQASDTQAGMLTLSNKISNFRMVRSYS
jgi:hypothetical protein